MPSAPAIAKPKQDLSIPRPFALILSEEIANSNASADTVKTYRQQFKLFVSWCDRNRLKVSRLTQDRITEYRTYLVERGFKVKTIALKLTVIRRIFDIAVDRGIMKFNPANRVKPPIEREDPAVHNNYLELEEAEKLLQTLPKDDSLKSLRDRLLVSLMVLQGCRQIELHRLNVGDIIKRGDRVGIKVRAKRSVRVIPLREDIAELLNLYINARKASGEILKPGNAMFISFSPNAVSLSENRLRRGSMQRIVNNYLEAAALRYCESRTVTSHGLRHTFAFLLHKEGKPLRVIQEVLGHADPKTTAIYAHVASLWAENPANALSLSLDC